MERLCQEAVMIFKAAVRAVKPENLIHKVMHITPPSLLRICQKDFTISHNVYVVGFGKAVFGMAVAVEQVIGDHLVRGIISVPKGIQEQIADEGLPCLQKDSRIEVFEGAANNLPDAEAMSAAKLIADLAASLKESDLLLVLISGGGSALVPLPVPDITLEEKFQVTKMLFTRGAPIQEINTVRKSLSVIKGGHLALIARPAQVVSLIISDIIGNPLDLIASGPTVCNVDDPRLPLTILEKYNLINDVPENIVSFLKEYSLKTASHPDSSFDHVMNILLGSNSDAVSAALNQAKDFNHVTLILTTELCGSARLIGQALANIACALLRGDDSALEMHLRRMQFPPSTKQNLLSAVSESAAKNKVLCLLCAGETVVQVTGLGIGGRNQELALSASIELHTINCKEEVVILSAGTDGIDGPTIAAGAIASPAVVQAALEVGLNPEEFLNKNDSFNFYQKVDKGQWHVITGHTGTNVMDIVIVLLKCK